MVADRHLLHLNAADRARINMGDGDEVHYWTQKWGVSQERLQQAVDKVGPSVKAVARELDVFE